MFPAENCTLNGEWVDGRDELSEITSSDSNRRMGDSSMFAAEGVGVDTGVPELISRPFILL